MNTLTLEHVSHRYGRLLAVDDVSLAVSPGEIVCLVGPSGCGKTTLLRLAAGLEPLQQGIVRIGEETVDGEGRHTPPEQRRVGLVFQDYALFPHLSVRDNIAFGLAHLDADERRARIDRALARIEMTAYADTFPHELSGGQQQRVALARAVVTRPRVVLLDEPFSGLDTRLRDIVRDDATQILRETGVSTLMVTHDPEEAMYVADRIAVMDEGRLRQIDTPTKIYTDPADAFVAGFFGEINRLDGEVAANGLVTALGTISGGPAEKARAIVSGTAGTAVDVLIRTEALRLDEPESGTCRATVAAARYLGRSSLVDVKIAGATQGDETALRVRVPGRYLPAAGTPLSVSMRGEGVFVFAKGPAG